MKNQERNERMWELLRILHSHHVPYNPPVRNWERLRDLNPVAHAALDEYLRLKYEEEQEVE